MIGWFSLNLPSGLGLYYLSNTVLTTAQQIYLRKLGGVCSCTMPASVLCTLPSFTSRGMAHRYACTTWPSAEVFAFRIMESPDGGSGPNRRLVLLNSALPARALFKALHNLLFRLPTS